MIMIPPDSSILEIRIIFTHLEASPVFSYYPFFSWWEQWKVSSLSCTSYFGNLSPVPVQADRNLSLVLGLCLQSLFGFERPHHLPHKLC